MSSIEDLDANKDMLERAQAKAKADIDASTPQEQDTQLKAALERSRQKMGSVKNICPTGGIVFADENMISFQRQVVWDAVKTIGLNLTSGKSINIINVSLPVRIFEPRSFLQRLTDSWTFASTFLGDASRQSIPIERLKCVISFVVAGLHQTVFPFKPFNPIIGETFQATYKSGIQVFMEQTSHHPPISHFQLFGPKNTFVLNGWSEMGATFRGNSVKGNQTGPNIITFSDGGEVSYTTPDLWINGILWGDRIAEYLGQMEFKDTANDLSCTITLNPDGVGYLKSFFVSSETPSDFFRGEIKQGAKVISKIDGSWIRSVNFDGNMFVDITKLTKPDMTLCSIEDILPSDCRQRSDMAALASGEYDAAQNIKTEMEELQRADNRERELGVEQRAAASLEAP